MNSDENTVCGVCGVSKVARCRRTKLTIPECSCPSCLDEQLRGMMRGIRAQAEGVGGRSAPRRGARSGAGADEVRLAIRGAQGGGSE
jgi:hypothetical protein